MRDDPRSGHFERSKDVWTRASADQAQDLLRVAFATREQGLEGTLRDPDSPEAHRLAQPFGADHRLAHVAGPSRRRGHRSEAVKM